MCQHYNIYIYTQHNIYIYPINVVNPPKRPKPFSGIRKPGCGIGCPTAFGQAGSQTGKPKSGSW